MKKLTSLLIVVVLLIGVVSVFAACTGKTYEVALVTDVGNIDDKSFNEGAWNGVKQFAEENGKTYKYYRPAEDSEAARNSSIEEAIKNGAKVIVCPGYLFESSVYEMQKKYPDVAFLFLDGTPSDGDDTTEDVIEKNVHCILYKEEQAGYLAGYAAVKDGYRKLGFMGGMAVPAVVRFGHGFIQGAEDAAKELGLAKDAVEVKFTYVNSFAPSDDIKTKAAGWYTEGTEVIFACGGGIYLSITAAAAEANKYVIGVDVDQYAATMGNATIISSAMKGLTETTIQALEAFYNNGEKWPEDRAGKAVYMGVNENAVGLPTSEASWRFNTYTVEEYRALYQAMVDGTVVVNVSSKGNELPTVEIVKIKVD